jgi:hypothetical protein
VRGLYRVSLDEAKGLVDGNDWAVIYHVARLTTPLLAGLWDGKLLCLIGLVPRSLLSDTAYLWLYDTPEAKLHRIAVVRHAKRLIDQWRQTYRLEGHCVTDSWRWLRSLGAIQTSQITFEIPRWPHH